MKVVNQPVFHVRITVQDGVAVFKPVGWLTAGNREGLDGRFSATRAHGCSRIVLDLSSIHFADSSYLGVLPFWKRRLDEAGGCLILASPSGAAMRALVAGHLNKYLPVCETVAEAVELAMQRTESGRWKPVTA
jgi:anti-anti-sigma factor